MNADEFDFVALQDLRVGLFVDLDLGWLAHPFSSSRFKIANDRQIEVLRGLGVDRIRFVPSKSDAVERTAPLEPAPDTSAQNLPKDEDPARALREQRAALRSAQQASLQHCERRFAESSEQYRKVVAMVESKPADAARMSQALVADMAAEIASQGDSAIRLLTEVAGDKAAMHPVNVTVISLLLGRAMGLQGEALTQLGTAAFLHDVGKSRLPERVRRWEENFSASEQKVYQDHVGESVQLAKQMGLGEGVVTAIAQHHEMVDGSGFPMRLKQDALECNGRILALVNRYDGLCNPAKPGSAMTPHEALALIFAQQKTRFDSVALSAFIRMMGVYPPGSVVQLNEIGRAHV